MSAAIRKNTCAAQVYWEMNVRNRQRNQGIATSLFREPLAYLDGVINYAYAGGVFAMPQSRQTR